MQVDYLIIGQGISGTWLSYFLQKAGKSFIVIDNIEASAPSRVAAGLINPVTGRRHAAVWLVDEVMPFAWKSYREIGHELNITAITEKSIIDFFPTAQMRLSFIERVDDKIPFVSLPADEKKFLPYFNYELGFGEIAPVYMANLEDLLPAWREKLLKVGKLIEEEFKIGELQVEKDEVRYGNILAAKIIFCDGAKAASYPWFDRLPFAPNKGEALILQIEGLSTDQIYKRGMTLAPLAEPDHWWIGSSYEWEFDNALPTELFRDRVSALLKDWLKTSYKIVDHLASLRPATLERRPFVGTHPVISSIAILNGMGTKGCSLAPFFAKQLTDHLLEGLPIYPEADINRFRKILSRS